jgi:hypothetical protein
MFRRVTAVGSRSPTGKFSERYTSLRESRRVQWGPLCCRTSDGRAAILMVERPGGLDGRLKPIVRRSAPR